MEEYKNTVIISEDDEDFDEKLKAASDALRKGALVVFPTETVFGLGANAYDEEACRAIYEAKGRPQDNPLIVHVSSKDMARALMSEIPPMFELLAEEFYPGPISLVVKKAEGIPAVVSGNLPTIAIRMPDNRIAEKLIKYAGVPIAAPSANLSGKPSPTRNSHVIEDLKGRVDYIILSNREPMGVESTVLDISSDIPVIYRPGGISKERIELVLGREVKLYDGRELKKGESPKSPGIKYKHYSPDAIVLESDKCLNSEDIRVLALEYGFLETEVCYIEYHTDVEMAKNLYADFRAADSRGEKLIIIKAAESGELLAAALNRLSRAKINKI